MKKQTKKETSVITEPRELTLVELKSVVFDLDIEITRLTQAKQQILNRIQEKIREQNQSAESIG